MEFWAPTSVSDLLTELQVDAAGREAIASLPQGSPEWLRSRWGRLTASNFGAASGKKGNAERLALVKHMVWPETAVLPEFVRRMTAYGTEHEGVARDIYVADRCRGNPAYADPRLRIFETGLLVSTSHGWLGASPDFVVEESLHARHAPAVPPTNAHHEYDPYVISHPEGHHLFLKGTKDVLEGPTGCTVVQGCGEIKCPAATPKEFYSAKGKHAKYGFPDFYYDQIQGAMAINSWPFCDAVVYTPDGTQVTRFRRNVRYWVNVLFPALEEFYFTLFIPVLERRLAGLLTPDTLSWSGLPAQVSLALDAHVTPHPVIEDPMPWFSRAPLPCRFVVVQYSLVAQ